MFLHISFYDVYICISFFGFKEIHFKFLCYSKHKFNPLFTTDFAEKREVIIALSHETAKMLSKKPNVRNEIRNPVKIMCTILIHLTLILLRTDNNKTQTRDQVSTCIIDQVCSKLIILSDCHILDEIINLLNAFRLKKHYSKTMTKFLTRISIVFWRLLKALKQFNLTKDKKSSSLSADLVLITLET